MLSFIKQREYEPVYRAIAYQSRKELYRDGIHYAVSWYFQNPELIDTTKYIGWVLKDVVDPRLWHRARKFEARGMFSATFTDVAGIGIRGPVSVGYPDAESPLVSGSDSERPEA